MATQRLSLFAALWLTTTATTQVTMTATSIESSAVSIIAPTASLPAGFDVSNGFSLQSFFNPFFGGSGAIQLLRVPMSFFLEAGADRGPPGGFGSAEGGADITITTPTPTLVRFTITHRRVESPQGATALSSFEIPGLFATTPCPLTTALCTDTYSTVTDAEGIVVQLRVSAVAMEVGSPFSDGGASVQFRIVEVPATGVAYGTSCGSTLSAVAVPNDPTSESVILDTPDDSLAGFVLVGGGQAVLPLPAPLPCDIQAAPILASAILPLNAEGNAQLTFPLPPGGAFTVQGGAVLPGPSITLSNGIQY